MKNTVLSILLAIAVMVTMTISPVYSYDFDLVCLGSGGGSFESDVTSFMIKSSTSKDFSLFLDGGSIMSGLVKYFENQGVKMEKMDPEDRVKYIAEFVKKMDGIIITHSHLDHVSGFSIMGPFFLNMNFQMHNDSFNLYSSPETIENLEKYLYSGKIWGNFGHFPKKNPILKYQPVKKDVEFKTRDFRVKRYLVRHKVESSAYLITNEVGNNFLFLRDTGTLSVEFWKKFRPFVKAQTLKGIVIEISFPYESNNLAAKTTHLTRDTFINQFSMLADIRPPENYPLTDKQIMEYGRKIAEKIKFPIIINHIKPWDYKKVIRDISLLKKSGINIIVAKQGEAYKL